jgi:hypothetical protein
VNVTDLPYIVAAYAICFAALGLYVASLVRRGSDRDRSG